MSEFETNNASEKFRSEVQRYFTFWPYFLVSFIIFLSASYIYLRYTDYEYRSVAKIEIIDKAQDSEMSLPTSMTIFNRSMINLDNEIGVLTSRRLNSKVINEISGNVKFYTEGFVKTYESDFSDWFDDYDFQLKNNPDEIDYYSKFIINIEDKKLEIKQIDNLGNENSYKFKSLSTKDQNDNLPFELEINNYLTDDIKIIQFIPFEKALSEFLSKLNITQSSQRADQLTLSIDYPNILIADRYLNTLMYEFDNDGIIDRQLEYKRTMDFVDSRSIFLSDELEKIENRKQDFKEKNNLSDLSSDAISNNSQKIVYNSELFDVKSQKDLLDLLENVIEKDIFKLMPSNIGIDDDGINQIINDYNITVKKRNRFLMTAGLNNPYIKNLEFELKEIVINLKSTIDNYRKSLDIKIQNLERKELEYKQNFSSIPENEKVLRAIERELEIKESLFLLLLQKREEAAINFSVVKPSIKIIDSAISSSIPVNPKKYLVYFVSILSSLFLPFSLLFLIFYFDTKIHVRDQVTSLAPNIPIVGELPQVKISDSLNKISVQDSRTPLSEGIRMIIANLNFLNLDQNKMGTTILVTSSIKGEGKTIVSVNLSSLLSYKKNESKVLLVGADLRNPQIHRFLSMDKNNKGLSDYLHLKDLNWKDLVIKQEKLDILLSGTIPPNPTETLSSEKFSKFMKEVKSTYDYIIIDSAPSLIVSDTFQISNYADLTLYVIRSNFSETKLFDFINESVSQNKLKNVNIVLNGIGTSKSYGYKYGYQYGYRYGYNYGYGYNYTEE